MQKQKSFTLNHKLGFTLNKKLGFILSLKSGFTLLELLVVISIIGVLASVVLVAFPGAKKKAQTAQGLQFSDSMRASLQANMIAWWPLDETTGSQVKDSYFNQLHGTVYGAAWVKGVLNNALQFDGSDDYVSVPHNNLLNLSSLTISAWVYPTAYQYYGNVVTKRYPAQYILRFYSTTGQIDGYIYGGGAWRYCNTPDTITAPLNQWTHLALSYDGTQGVVYVNGKVGCSFNYTGTVDAGTAALQIGSYYTGANQEQRVKGMIDNVQIFDTGLRFSQIEQLYAEGLKTRQAVAVK